MFFKNKRDTSQDIKIAGIYTCCYRLGLPKYGEPKHADMHALATMKSGKVALYRYREFEPASGLDWGWHVFEIERYATPEEEASLPWLTDTPAEHAKKREDNPAP